MKQFGQVFLVSSKNFIIACTTCGQVLVDYNEFRRHVFEAHLDPLSIDKHVNITTNDKFIREEAVKDSDAIFVKQDPNFNHDLITDFDQPINESDCTGNLNLRYEKELNMNKEALIINVSSDSKETIENIKVNFTPNSIKSDKQDEINECKHDINKVVCLYCGEYFSSEHFQSHQAQRKCGKCPVCLIIVTDLFRHVKKFHKEYVENKRKLKERAVKRLPLSESGRSSLNFSCNKILNEKEVSKQDQEIELVESDGKCKSISLGSDDNELGNPLLCKYCEKTFKSKGNYNKHITQHETKSDTCSYCGKRFKYLSRLVKHLRLHTGEKPYKCEICLASFNESSNLKAHFINRHTEGLNIKCTYDSCGKVFKTNARRKYHERYAHSRKYTNLCKECGLVCRTSGSLNEHTKKQHLKYEDRQFSCKYCDKRFAFKFEVIPHEMVHTGQKKYKCELCTKGFIARKSYKRHCRTVHGKEVEEIEKKE